MLDFLLISTRSTKRGVIEVYPKFIVKKSKDLMIRGGDFYAIWVEERGLWSTDEEDAIRMIDAELDGYCEKHFKSSDTSFHPLHMWDAESGMIDAWHKYCQRQLRDSFRMLDENLIFSNTETKKSDYASKKLPYPLEKRDIPAWDRMMSVLYSPPERHKIEWAIGSIVSGDSKKLQKFLVLYGAAGTGKSTVLNVIQQLFEGYYSVFDARALGSSNDVFALEAFRTNPLVAIQHDGDLSRIEDNTRLNSLVSHEIMTVNEKFKQTYTSSFKCFLFMGTNKPVRITDAKSGLIRRLIDVAPTGDKLSASEYKRVTAQVKFELGGIAQHCLEVYSENPGAYDDYIPINMLGASNDFYNFVQDSYNVFAREDQTTLKAAWEMYRTYCEDAKVFSPYSQRIFKEELKNYFHEYKERITTQDGTRVRSWYGGFRTDKFEEEIRADDIPEPVPTVPDWLKLKEGDSPLDILLKDSPAQYATEDGKPKQRWAEVTSKLRDIQTSELHYVKPPEIMIVIDFDLRGEDGNKSIERNLEAAANWPPTYAELSKSEAGLHLHYIYTGDVSELSSVYGEHVEVKIFTGGSSLRRKLTKHNGLQVAELGSGLPLKAKKMVDFARISSEKGLRKLIERNLRKEIHPGTKPSVDFIAKILDDTYKSGLVYDVSDMRGRILAFAANSTNHPQECVKTVMTMKFASETKEEQNQDGYSAEEPITFFDVEVFVNLFIVVAKERGRDNIIKLINPSPSDIEALMKRKLVGFNCRRYDNHILYGRLIGYSNEQLYELSQKIVGGDKNCFFGEAYNVSYTDIYDFSSKKQSLKKFEIELGIHHKELGIPWDQPVPEDRWEEVADYCVNDVIATEQVFEARQSDFLAREILADLAGMTVNDTTNSLTARIIFGNEKKPQSAFNYRNLGDLSALPEGMITETADGYSSYEAFTSEGKPIFPGYKYDKGVSTYRGEEVGEGGYVYAEPGIWFDVALLDIASMHPSSIIAENLFGKYTENFAALKEARVLVKHGEFEKAGKMFGGKLAKFLTDEERASNLAGALKIAINAVYGLTSASFDNPFHDSRNVDNIVAKRGALFMINLKHFVQEQGFTVAHIKTDSIKIPNATPDIIRKVQEYGLGYGYVFEHEATYERMCLVNDAVYIAKYKDGKHAGEWTATGTQFQVPFVFKTLFSKEDIRFEDLCETKSVSTALYLDFNEGLPEGEHRYSFVGKVGSFCPILPGKGGGELLRLTKTKEGTDGYSSATGCKGYRWMEAETVRLANRENDIDRSYYVRLADEAVETIKKYGDYQAFTE